MPMKIAILEDNEDRRTAMRACLADRFYQYEAEFFDDARELIAFLQANLSDTILISLDNDLELKPDGQGRWIDPGSGQDVAAYLTQRAPACPVVLATTNTLAAAGMEGVLRESGWETHRVIPFDDVNWIPGEWFRAVRRGILGMARPAK